MLRRANSFDISDIVKPGQVNLPITMFRDMKSSGSPDTLFVIASFV